MRIKLIPGWHGLQVLCSSGRLRPAAVQSAPPSGREDDVHARVGGDRGAAVIYKYISRGGGGGGPRAGDRAARVCGRACHTSGRAGRAGSRVGRARNSIPGAGAWQRGARGAVIRKPIR